MGWLDLAGRLQPDLFCGERLVGRNSALGDGAAGGGVGSGRGSFLAEDLFLETSEAGDEKEGEYKEIGIGAVGEGGSDFGEDFSRGHGFFDRGGEKAS